jgi:hypothetical protein
MAGSGDQRAAKRVKLLRVLGTAIWWYFCTVNVIRVPGI